MSDGAVCDLTTADEFCLEGACIPDICGDGITGPAEACDDGDLDARDGCSPRCDSDETCGNGIADMDVGEECDDSNLLDHDGCSSACKLETARWWHRPTALTGRVAPLMAYNSARDRILVVGGVGDELIADGVVNISLADSWEWDGRWREVLAQPPPPRSFGSMTYDWKHDRTFLFSGAQQNSVFGDLWAFDGVRWELVVEDTIEPRRSAALFYDPFKDTVVAFGGFINTDATGNATTEYWEWNGTQWGQVAGGNASLQSVRRAEAGVAYDPKRNRIVLFGGRMDGATLLNDVWEYDGTTWTKKFADTATPGATGPTRRAAMAMAWNATCECIVVFGGVTGSSTVSNETWKWNGSTWTKSTQTANLPAGRSYAAMASDGHGKTILAGGSLTVSTSSDPTVYPHETWVFDGTTWSQERSHDSVAVAYDSRRHRVVLYGGRIVNGTDVSTDTLELSDRGWELRATGGPSSNFGAMVYDEARGESVYYETAGTWIWNGSAWSPRGSATRPATVPRLVYDVARSEVVGFGGSAAETWTWNGTEWLRKTPATSPPRPALSLGYDRARQQVVAFGSVTTTSYVSDTWVWDGANWTEHLPSGKPVPSAIYPKMAWDPTRKKLMLLSGDYFRAWEWDGTWWTEVPNIGTRANPPGGFVYPSFDGSGITVSGGYYATLESSDTWELRWGTDDAGDLCTIAVDGDGDMLAGCADDDCWAVCTPSCFPGEACDPAAPRCGDATCGPAESCRSCPSDCTSCGSVCGDGVCDSGETCPGDC